MSKFSEAILKAFGMAAHEAEDQAAVEALIPTAATALDAEPAADMRLPVSGAVRNVLAVVAAGYLPDWRATRTGW